MLNEFELLISPEDRVADLTALSSGDSQMSTAVTLKSKKTLLTITTVVQPLKGSACEEIRVRVTQPF